MKHLLFEVLLAALVQPIAGGLTPSFFHERREQHNALKPAVGKGMNKQEREGKMTSDNPVGNFRCGQTYKAKSDSNKDEVCPEDCPLFAQDRTDDRHCTFICVPATDCAKHNPNKPIPDWEHRVCRAPMVEACLEYVLDGTDTCKVCQWGYTHGSDNLCHYWISVKVALIALATILVVVIVVLIVWFIDMWMRPIVNQENLDYAIEKRELCKIRCPVLARDHDGNQDSSFAASSSASIPFGGTSSTTEGVSPKKKSVSWSSHSGAHLHLETHPWPLRTNLCKKDVAGPGMLLHFNFQVAIMVWALMVAIGWTVLCYAVDSDLLRLGTRRFGTPRQNCVMVAWGYEKQQSLLDTKIMFLYVAYFSSVILALIHSVRQLRMYQHLDHHHTTMKDFCALASGLPTLSGKDTVEEDLKQALADFTQEEVVGVSVAWMYQDQEDEINTACKNEQDKWLATPRHFQNHTSIPEGGYWMPVRRKLNDLELKYLGPTPAEETNEEMSHTVTRKLTEVLESMESSENAFIVFASQEARDQAIQKVAENSFEFEGQRVKLEVPVCEPDTVNWSNFGNHSHGEKTKRLVQGLGLIIGALACWGTLFYGPYAWSVYNFNYDNGMEPGPIYGIAFSMIVVAGNAIMYEACNQVSEYVGFRFKDHKEACYMVLYTISCTLNIILDMVTTYLMAWQIMTNLGFRDYFGKRLDDIDPFPEGFETYAIQRSLAENTYAYAFPSTFLIPFVIEPLPTIILPLMVGKLIVRSHREIAEKDAADWVAAAPMEMGRYADILLDVVLAILIFFFPGGYTATLFLALVVCHMWIYAFDHYRVLRVVPNCTFASMEIDWCSQVMLAPCCGLIIACVVFKTFTQAKADTVAVHGATVPLDFSAKETVLYSSIAFSLHCVVHILVLFKVVPLFGVTAEEKLDDDEPLQFKECAKVIAHSWFTTNPVHCLRSKLIYHHSPPCILFTPGKEHVLQVNEKIGCHFKISHDAEKV